MEANLYKRRYSLFLFSFILMLFGDIFTKPEHDYDAQTVLIFQNMVFSLLLLRHKNKLQKLIVISLIIGGIFSRIYFQFNHGFSGYMFLTIYIIYFLIISYQIYLDLMQEKELGLEMISAAFSGYILLGTVFSILFITMGSSGAFKGPEGAVPNNDYLYFSFVTLLTIGYGDITPVTEIAKKIIVLLGLTGHFYTVFVIGIIIGKYINLRKLKFKDEQHTK